MSLASILPAPTGKYEKIENPFEGRADARHEQTNKYPDAPRYGARSGFIPRNIEDFGDGGAFPEIHVLQYPLDMGRKEKSAGVGRGGSGHMVPLSVDAEGNVQYDAILRQGMRKDMKLFSKFTDLIEKDFDDDDLARPSLDEQKKVAEKTRAALGVLTNEATAAAQPTHIKKQNLKEPVFIRYTPSQQGDAFNSGAQQRIIRLQEMPVDPLEPPKFKHKKLPPGPPSPPPPVMHSPPRKITVQDQQNWKIPPCISNWKNIKGYTIPLDKRLAADGRGLQDMQINDKFAKLSEALFVAERTARKEIEKRGQMMKMLQRKQKEQKESELRDMAARARQAGTAALPDEEPQNEEEMAAHDDREELRRDRKREIRRDLRMEQIKADKKAKGEGKGVVRSEKDRDISEKIALGQHTQKSKDMMFDQRLFNQDDGVAAGFGGEDSYNVYDKPLFKGSSANYIYRPKEGGGGGDDGESDVTKLLEKTARKFQADKGFSGTEEGREGGSRDKPVEFERDEADPFGLGGALGDSKKRKTLDKIGGQGYMKAAGGGSKLDRDEDRSRDRSKKMEFEESSGSKRGRRSPSGSGSRSASRSPGRDKRRRH